MKSRERRDTGEDSREYLQWLMQEEGVIEEGVEPNDDYLRHFDRKRDNKKVSNEEWVSESDAEARITKMKDGTCFSPGVKDARPLCESTPCRAAKNDDVPKLLSPRS